MNILIATIIYLIAQTIVWFQNFGHIKVPWIKENIWIVYLLSIPVTMMFMKATEFAYKGLGNAWSIRFLGFSVGIVTFSILTTYYFDETITPKLIVSISISIILIMIQLFWK